VELDFRSLLLGFMAASAVILSVAVYLAHLAQRWSTEGDAGFERLESLEGLLSAGQLSTSAKDEVVATWLFPPAPNRPNADHAKEQQCPPVLTSQERQSETGLPC
jgi:hypothetical protein